MTNKEARQFAGLPGEDNDHRCFSSVHVVIGGSKGAGGVYGALELLTGRDREMECCCSWDEIRMLYERQAKAGPAKTIEVALFEIQAAELFQQSYPTIRKYLKALFARGIAENCGIGPNHRYRLRLNWPQISQYVNEYVTKGVIK